MVLVAPSVRLASAITVRALTFPVLAVSSLPTADRKSTDGVGSMVVPQDVRMNADTAIITQASQLTLNPCKL